MIMVNDQDTLDETAVPNEDMHDEEVRARCVLHICSLLNKVSGSRHGPISERGKPEKGVRMLTSAFIITPMLPLADRSCDSAGAGSCSLEFL